MRPHEVMSYLLTMCVCMCVSPAREAEALGLACKRDSEELERVAPGFLDCQPSWLQQKQDMREYVVAALLSEQLMEEDPHVGGPHGGHLNVFCRKCVIHSFMVELSSGSPLLALPPHLHSPHLIHLHTLDERAPA